MSTIAQFVEQHFSPLTDETPFPLTDQMMDEKEVIAMIENILSNHITYGPKVVEFEKSYASFIGAAYVVMVNSGSSANLLAFAALMNPMRSVRLEVGDNVLVPSVCWSTSVAPIIQLGCVPVYVDVLSETANIDIEHMERLLKADAKIKAIVVVYVIGASCNMETFMSIVRKYNLMVIEDTCESMGSTYNEKCLGTFGRPSATIMSKVSVKSLRTGSRVVS